MPVYKNEDKNTWYASFYYTDWQGNRKKKKKEGFPRKKDAQEFERKFLLQQSGSCEMAFGEMTELYLADCKTRQKPTSYYTKENMINNLILPYFKDMPVKDITAVSVRQWQNTLLSDSKGYSQNYLHTVNGHLSAIFNYAVKFYGLRLNPARECGKIKSKATKINYWKLEQFNTFMQLIGETYPVRTMFLLLFWTGIRVGELLALTLDDFDFEAHTLHISKSFARLNKTDIIQTPKTEKSNRIISIPAFLEDEVKKYAAKLYDYEPSERLFNVSKELLTYYIKKVCEASDLPKIRIHDLRHSHASMLINMGFSPLLVQERLGHEKIETTLNIYSHLYQDTQEELSTKLQEQYSTLLVR